MKRAVSTCPTVNLNVQGKEVPSLMDLGSMVTLIREGYFKKIIPFESFIGGNSVRLTLCLNYQFKVSLHPWV